MTLLPSLLALTGGKPIPAIKKYDYTILEERGGKWYRWYMKHEKAGVDHLGFWDRSVPVWVAPVEAP